MGTDYDYGVGGAPTVGAGGMFNPDYSYSSGREHMGAMPVSQSPYFDPYSGGTTSVPGYNFELQPYLNNAPIGPDWLRQNLAQTDPSGTAFRAPGYDPSIPMQELANEWGLGQAKQLAQSQADALALMGQNQKDIYGAQIVQQGIAYDRAKGFANTDFDIGSRKLDLQQGAVNRQRPYLGTLHDLALQGMNDQAGQTRRALESNLTAKGAFTSIGGQQGRFDIAKGLLRGTKEENARYQENLAQLDDKAKDLGLDREQLQNDLQKGLENLGVSNFMSVSDLMAKMYSTDIEVATKAQQFFNDAIAAGPTLSRLYPGPSDQYQPGPAAQTLSVNRQRK